MIIFGVGTLAAPFCRSLMLFYTVCCVAFVGGGAWDGGQSVWLIELWGDRSMVVLQIAQFMYGLGGILGPLLCKPFITGEIENPLEMPRPVTWSNSSHMAVTWPNPNSSHVAVTWMSNIGSHVSNVSWNHVSTVTWNHMSNVTSNHVSNFTSNHVTNATTLSPIDSFDIESDYRRGLLLYPFGISGAQCLFGALMLAVLYIYRKCSGHVLQPPDRPEPEVDTKSIVSVESNYYYRTQASTEQLGPGGPTAPRPSFLGPIKPRSLSTHRPSFLGAIKPRAPSIVGAAGDVPERDFRTVVITLLSSVFFAFYYGLEYDYFAFVAPFAKYSALHWSEEKAAVLNSFVCIAYAVSKLVFLALAFRVRIQYLLVINFCLILTGNGVLLFSGQYALAMWVGNFILGAGCSSVIAFFWAYLGMSRILYLLSAVINAVINEIHFQKCIYKRKDAFRQQYQNQHWCMHLCKVVHC